jgi:hypothetical protein
MDVADSAFVLEVFVASVLVLEVFEALEVFVVSVLVLVASVACHL